MGSGTELLDTFGTRCLQHTSQSFYCKLHLIGNPVLSALGVVINAISLLLLRKCYAIEKKLKNRRSSSRLSAREISILLRIGASTFTFLLCYLGFPIQTELQSPLFVLGLVFYFGAVAFTVTYVVLASMSVARLSTLFQDHGKVRKQSYSKPSNQVVDDSSRITSTTVKVILPQKTANTGNAGIPFQIAIRDVLGSPITVALHTYVTFATWISFGLMYSSTSITDKVYYGHYTVFHGATGCMLVTLFNFVVAGRIRVRVIRLVYSQLRRQGAKDKQVRGVINQKHYKQRAKSLQVAILHYFVELLAGSIGATMFAIIASIPWRDGQGAEQCVALGFAAYLMVHLAFAITDFLKVLLRRSKALVRARAKANRVASPTKLAGSSFSQDDQSYIESKTSGSIVQH